MVNPWITHPVILSGSGTGCGVTPSFVSVLVNNPSRYKDTKCPARHQATCSARWLTDQSALLTAMNMLMDGEPWRICVLKEHGWMRQLSLRRPIWTHWIMRWSLIRLELFYTTRVTLDRVIVVFQEVRERTIMDRVEVMGRFNDTNIWFVGKFQAGLSE